MATVISGLNPESVRDSVTCGFALTILCFGLPEKYYEKYDEEIFMKRLIHCLAVTLVCFSLTACPPVPENNLFSQHPSTLQFQAIQFDPPEAARVVLENGMVLYLLEDHELPLIDITAAIRGGSKFEPPELAGLGSLTGTVMRTGGTLRMPPQEIDETLEFIDALVAVSIERESGSASLSVLKKDLDVGLDIFAQILREPAFDPEKLDLAKKQKIAGLQRIKDNPQSLAMRQFQQLLYRDNPRGNLATRESIKNIDREHLIKFHKTFFHPNRMFLAISGDFSRQEIITAIKQRFADWPANSDTMPEIPIPRPISKLATFYLQKEIPQSTIIFGHFGPKKSDSDYFTFKTLNFILGDGGFSSHLTSKIRSSRGLAYSVGSFFSGGEDYGVFGAYCMTKSSSTHQALSLMFDIIGDIKQGKVLQHELEWAKASILNSIIFSYSSSAQIVNQQMLLEFEHLPADFLKKIPARINAVLLDDLKRVAQQHLHPSEAILLVVGDAGKFDQSLETWGPVTEVSSDL
jgi:predicted Zn-dependent peptidase